jgi:SSS family solute:Na+ symporter
MPVIVVLPGIAAVVLYPNLSSPDLAYPSMMSLMPVGIKGLVFAALVAAIVSSLASMTNSISTIFTMDIYSKLKQGETQRHYVMIGRIATLVSLVVALLTARPLLGQFEQAFQYIQEFTGLFTPGIVVIFITGMFWKRATSLGALAAAIGSAIFSIIFKYLLPNLPFMDRIGIVFLLCLALTVIVSLVDKPSDHDNSVNVNEVSFSTGTGFNIAAIGCVMILTFFYVTWW